MGRGIPLESSDDIDGGETIKFSFLDNIILASAMRLAVTSAADNFENYSIDRYIDRHINRATKQLPIFITQEF